MDKTASTILDAIKGWNIAAEKDDIVRYFYPFDAMKAIESGSISVVIGHKGEGKSAIAEWLRDVNSPGKKGRCAKLSLKDFDLGILYRLADRTKALQSEYTTLWSYIIILSICREMMTDNSIDPQQLHYIKRRMKKEFSKAGITVESIIDRGGGFTIAGWGFNFGQRTRDPSSSLRWLQSRIDIFRDAIKHVKISKHYHIIFDELDDDYHDIKRNSENFELYRGLLVGLIRAIDQTSTYFRLISKEFFPTMMLRKDVYEAIHFNDKGKFADKVLDIGWTEGRINSLVAFRVARAADPSIDAEAIPSHADVWATLFDLTDFAEHSCSIKRLSDYIYGRTFGRPRDFVAFLRFCAVRACARRHTKGIMTRDVIAAEGDYSKYLRQEIEDAIAGIHPDLLETIKAVSDLGKRVFAYIELETALASRMTDSLKANLSTKQVIDLLFYFNVIGRNLGSQHGVFNFGGRDETVGPGWVFIVHRGLWREFNLSRGSQSELKAAIEA